MGSGRQSTSRQVMEGKSSDESPPPQYQVNAEGPTDYGTPQPGAPEPPPSAIDKAVTDVKKVTKDAISYLNREVNKTSQATPQGTPQPPRSEYVDTSSQGPGRPAGPGTPQQGWVQPPPSTIDKVVTEVKDGTKGIVRDLDHFINKTPRETPHGTTQTPPSEYGNTSMSGPGEPAGHGVPQQQPQPPPPSTIDQGPDTVVYQQPTFRYGREPMQDHTCPFCNSLITTKVKKSQGAGAYVGCLGICCAGLCCLLCLLGCQFIPFCMEDCKMHVHYCPNCNAMLGKHTGQLALSELTFKRK